jgi:hypothetical protein
MRMIKETCDWCGKVKMTSAKSFSSHQRNCQKKYGIKKEAVQHSVKEGVEMKAMHQDRVEKLKEKKTGEFINPMKQFHKTLPSAEEVTEVEYRKTDFEQFRDHMEKYEEYKTKKAQMAREKYEKKKAEERIIKMKLEKEEQEKKKKQEEVKKIVTKPDDNPYSSLFAW